MSNKYYVYILKNPLKNNLPFYIGKGSGERYKTHWKQIKSKKFNDHLDRTISKIKSNGFSFYNYEIINCLNEQKAFEKEQELIKFFGKRCDGSGVLVNFGNGGKGGNFGGVNGPKKVKKYNIFREYLKTYDSIQQAAFDMNLLNSSSIVACCKKTNGYKTSKGYVWCYEDEEPDWKYVTSKNKPIYQWSTTGELINRFKNIKEFEKETNFKGYNIINFINNQIKGNGSCSLPYGFIFTRTFKFLKPKMRKYTKRSKL